jgi:hypothetical protein
MEPFVVIKSLAEGVLTTDYLKAILEELRSGTQHDLPFPKTGDKET